MHSYTPLSFETVRLPAWVAAVAVGCAVCVAPAHADTVGDLDLLAAATVPPNVMIVLDNSGSMKTALEGSTRIEIAGVVLTNLVNTLYPDDGAGGYTTDARLGLAIFDPTGGRQGGQIEVEIANNNKVAMLAGISTTVTNRLNPASPGTGTLLSEALVDVGRYFAGEHGFGSYPAVATTSPMDLECRDSFVVFMSDGEPNDDENDQHGIGVIGTTAHAAFVSTIGNADGDANECSLLAPAICIDDPNGGRDDGQTYSNADGTDWFDDVAYYLARTDLVPDNVLDEDQVVYTYTVGFALDHFLLSEAATNGKGQYFTANNAAALTARLTDAFNAIFDQTRASFTSAVVPGASLGLGNGFYNSFFTSSDEPVWEGHLEALRISPTGEIQDANLDPAIDPVTGALLDTRVPFWDAATPLTTNTSRTIYTTVGGSQVSFDNSNVSDTDLGLTVAEIPSYPNNPGSGVDDLTKLRDAVIDYVRGKDAFDEDNNADATEMRGTVLGDIFHSTPRAIAAPTRFMMAEDGYSDFYNAHDDRDRTIYAGANDALLHAFDAGEFFTGDDVTTPEAELTYYSPGFGTELFGYVPGVILDRAKLLPRNSPRTEYFVDGPIAAADAWLGDGSGTDTTKTGPEWATVLITGMREGGRGYLALDVSDPDDGIGDDHGPYPVLLWEFSEADLGETWSEPVITRVRMKGAVASGDKCGHNDGDGDCREQWVAIFGGGYEPDGDPNRPSYISNPADAQWSDRSKAIYMVALDSGQVLAKVEFDALGTNGPAGMKYSIPSTPAVIDLDFDGFADVVYVGDLGGQMWKWDIHQVAEDTDADPLVDNYTAGVFFSTAATVLPSSALHYRSFFFSPAASFVKGQLVLAFGSGERHNLGYEGDATVSENNRFYVAKDVTPTGVGAFATTLTDASLTDVTALDTDTTPLDAGYYFQLEESEKFVTEVTVFAGFVIAGSYTPIVTADICATLGGQSFLHVFRLSDGQGFFPDPADPPSEDRRVHIGGGFPTSPVVTVGNDPNDDVIIIKTSDGPRVITVNAPPRTDPKGSLIYWKQQL